MKRKAIEVKTARNVNDLIDALRSLSCDDTSVVHTQNAEGQPVVLTLFENTLSDGSITYDIRIS